MQQLLFNDPRVVSQIRSAAGSFCCPPTFQDSSTGDDDVCQAKVPKSARFFFFLAFSRYFFFIPQSPSTRAVSPFGQNWLTNIPDGRRRALPNPPSALTDWTRMEVEAGRMESHLECGEGVHAPPLPPGTSSLALCTIRKNKNK